ncbi:unnamed protein product [Kluyveromyces dobzhanskii CBS 2104]|uniref:Putative lipoate-protein ligase A n=1 Tax=Kluyveromyces dobzhanskii CBS 2104 TaxID=1427455 RepID=A0A0A8L8F2_9SACH|nr:unnamed protein product [Kluyveromyces dobzhanskii CBS 2104]
MLSQLYYRPVHRLWANPYFRPQRLYSAVSNKVPFELDETDDKYSEFNNFYSELFTSKDEPTGACGQHSELNSKSELDELNEELGSMYSIDVLSSAELEKKVKANGRFVFRSTSTNPYFNLALEDYVFRNTPLTENKTGNERILFYTNDKCVVIGKNQNPWKEIFMKNVGRRGYRFVRRHSGGGAVVHDLGNVNYSYLTSRESFRREFFNQQLVQWLDNEDISLNNRGDLTYKDHKISGSAFKIAKGKAYHHGTMLIDSDLAQFKGLLKPDVVPGVTWTCNSVESVRSKVTNIGREALTSIDHFCSLITDQFRALVDDPEIPMLYCDESSSLPEISEAARVLESKEWNFMSGPKFELTCEGVSLKIEKGIIVESDLPELLGSPFYEFYDNLEENDGKFKSLL